jgi:hypothetical protein
MGDKFNLVADKVIDDLPSPSGGSNTSNFNSNNDTLGLKNDLYNYMMLIGNKADIEFVRKQWNTKQTAEMGVKVTRIPKGMLKKYKGWKYRNIFPLIKCQS